MLAVSIAGPGYHLIPRSSWSLLPCLRWAHIGRPAAGGATSAWAPERPDRAPPSRRRGCVLAWSNGQRIAGCYRRRVTQRSIRATTPAHTTTSAGTVAVSVKLAPSSAGPIAKMSNASRPAPQTKAGFGKLSIERPLNRAHISNNTRRGRKFGGPKDRLRTPLLAPNLWTPPSSDAAMALCKFRKFYMCSRGLLAAQSEASPRREPRRDTNCNPPDSGFFFMAGGAVLPLPLVPTATSRSAPNACRPDWPHETSGSATTI
jgi:hypothetical protein